MLYVSEELLLLALHDQKGTVGWSTSDGLDYGLAGALLTDLLLAGRLSATGEHLVVADAESTGNEVLDEALARVGASSRPRGARHWVDDLHGMRRLRDRLLERLVGAGVLRREAGRELWIFPTRRYPAARDAPEREVRRRLLDVLVEGAPPDERTAVLAGLARACGVLDGVVPREHRKVAGQRAEEIARSSEVTAGVSGAITDVTTTIVVAVVAASVASTTAATSGGGASSG